MLTIKRDRQNQSSEACDHMCMVRARDRPGRPWMLLLGDRDAAPGSYPSGRCCPKHWNLRLKGGQIRWARDRMGARLDGASSVEPRRCIGTIMVDPHRSLEMLYCKSLKKSKILQVRMLVVQVTHAIRVRRYQHQSHTVARSAQWARNPDRKRPATRSAGAGAARAAQGVVPRRT